MPRSAQTSSSASGIGAPPTTTSLREREVGVCESRLLGHEEVVRRDAHHRRDPLALDQLERSGRVEAALEHDLGALPPGEDRLNVPAAAVELRQHLQDDVVRTDPGREVEGEVRPEAVRVREQRALRLPGRARGVDEEQRVVVRRTGARCAPRARLQRQGGRHARERERGLAELAVLVLDEEDGRLGVVELVGDLGRGEPPRDRVEDRPGLRAREHERNVLARVAGERRDAVPVATGSEPARRTARRARRRSRCGRARRSRSAPG